MEQSPSEKNTQQLKLLVKRAHGMINNDKYKDKMDLDNSLALIRELDGVFKLSNHNDDFKTTIERLGWIGFGAWFDKLKEEELTMKLFNKIQRNKDNDDNNKNKNSNNGNRKRKKVPPGNDQDDIKNPEAKRQRLTSLSTFVCIYYKYIFIRFTLGFVCNFYLYFLFLQVIHILSKCVIFIYHTTDDIGNF